MAWLLSSMSQSILFELLECETTRKIWKILNARFSSRNLARVLDLKTKLETIKKGSLKFKEYFAKIKNLVDSLAAAGRKVSHEDHSSPRSRIWWARARIRFHDVSNHRQGRITIITEDNDHRFQVDLPKWYCNSTSYQQLPHSKKQVRTLGKFFSFSFLWGFFQWFFAAGENCGFVSFPTFGLKAYNYKFYFDFSASYVGVGMICPYIINISVLLGGILSWGLMWPLIEKRKGDWFSAELPPSSFHGLQGYKVFISIALILGDGVYNFVKVLGTALVGLHRQLKKKDVIPVSDVSSPSTSDISFDDKRRTQLFLKDQIPSWFSIGGYVMIAVVSIATLPRILPLLKWYYMVEDTLPHIFPQLKWYYILVIYVIAPVLAFCNAYGTGLTDVSLASTYGKLAIFMIGTWAGAAHGGVVAGLAACGIMMNIVSTASDLMQDFKTGYMTLSSPRSMFVSQVVGTAMGCVISPCVFWLFYKAFDDLGQLGSTYPAPYAVMYRNIALLTVEGFSGLPKNCLTLCYGFFAAAIVINLIRDLSGKKASQFVPIPMAMAIPFSIGPYFAIDMCLGSLILFVWKKINKAKAEAFAPAVAAGLICGDGMWTLPSSILSLAGVKPPICMKFLSRTTNVKVDNLLASS